MQGFEGVMSGTDQWKPGSGFRDLGCRDGESHGKEK